MEIKEILSVISPSKYKGKEAELANILEKPENTKKKKKNKGIKHRKRGKEFIKSHKPTKIEKILSSISIQQVQEILKQLGIEMKYKNTQHGKELIGLCPFHKEKTPSFTYAGNKGFFHCFGCGAHGDIFKVLQRALNINRFKSIKIVEYFLSENKLLTLEEYLECQGIATIKINEAWKNIKVSEENEEDLIEF